MSKTLPTWSFALIAGIFWVVSVGLFALGRHEQEKSRTFMSTARPARGKVVGYVVWKEKDQGLSSRVRERTIPEIEFRTDSGQVVRFAAASSGTTVFSPQESEYPVLYDPSNPSRAQLDAGIDKAFWVLYACVVLCGIPSVVFTILWLRRLSATG
jgi:hypothetical protein